MHLLILIIYTYIYIYIYISYTDLNVYNVYTNYTYIICINIHIIHFYTNISSLFALPNTHKLLINKMENQNLILYHHPPINMEDKNPLNQYNGNKPTNVGIDVWSGRIKNFKQGGSKVRQRIHASWDKVGFMIKEVLSQFTPPLERAPEHRCRFYQ